MVFDVCSWKRAVGPGWDYMVVNAGNCSTCVPGMGPRHADIEWLLPRSKHCTKNHLHSPSVLPLNTLDLPLILLASVVHSKESKGALVKKVLLMFLKVLRRLCLMLWNIPWDKSCCCQCNFHKSHNHRVIKLGKDLIKSNPSCIDKYQQFPGRRSDLRINMKKQENKKQNHFDSGSLSGQQ